MIFVSKQKQFDDIRHAGVIVRTNNQKKHSFSQSKIAMNSFRMNRWFFAVQYKDGIKSLRGSGWGFSSGDIRV